MISNLEEVGEFVVKGWALHRTKPSITISLDIFINQQFVARIPAGTFRSDLRAMGYGDGYHAFFFNPFDYLSKRENLIEVKDASSHRCIDGGYRMVATGLATNRALHQKAQARSYLRWAAPDDRSCGGAAFFRHLHRAVHFHPGVRILEIGPGTGDLLARVLRRNKLFSSYTAIDLSRAAVDSLHARFASGNIQFLTGDAARYPFNSHFDLIVASAVCETLFPSFLPLLKNVSPMLSPGGMLAFDLMAQDDRISISRAEWNGDDFLRFYSQSEIRRQLAYAGMEMIQAALYEKTPGEHRVFVTAMKLPCPV